MKVWLGWLPLTPVASSVSAAVAARRQGDGLPGGADDVVSPGGAEVERRAAGVRLAPSRLADRRSRCRRARPPKVVPSATIPVRLKLEERLTCVDVGRGVAVAGSRSASVWQ